MDIAAASKLGSDGEQAEEGGLEVKIRCEQLETTAAESILRVRTFEISTTGRSTIKETLNERLQL